MTSGRRVKFSRPVFTMTAPAVRTSDSSESARSFAVTSQHINIIKTFALSRGMTAPAMPPTLSMNSFSSLWQSKYEAPVASAPVDI